MPPACAGCVFAWIATDGEAAASAGFGIVLSAVATGEGRDEDDGHDREQRNEDVVRHGHFLR